MLASIPAQILTHNVVFRIPTAETDTWGKANWQEQAITGVCIQPTHKVVIGKDSKERQLNAILFYDCRLSHGAAQLQQWQTMAESVNKEIEVVYSGRTYHLATIDWLVDDEGNPPHWELGLC